MPVIEYIKAKTVSGNIIINLAHIIYVEETQDGCIVHAIENRDIICTDSYQCLINYNPWSW